MLSQILKNMRFGIVLKCPFDKSKYYGTQKSEVLNQIKPNWARRISLSDSVYIKGNDINGYFVPFSGN